MQEARQKSGTAEPKGMLLSSRLTLLRRMFLPALGVFSTAGVIYALATALELIHSPIAGASVPAAVAMMLCYIVLVVMTPRLHRVVLRDRSLEISYYRNNDRVSLLDIEEIRERTFLCETYVFVTLRSPSSLGAKVSYLSRRFQRTPRYWGGEHPDTRLLRRRVEEARADDKRGRK